MFNDRAIALLAIGQTLIWASIYYIFPALLLRWEEDLGWTKAELTGAITLAVLISAFASPVAGKVIDQGKGPLLLFTSAILGGAGVVLLSAIETLWQFYTVWLLIGLAMSGCLYEPCFALVTRARGKQAKRGIIVITLFAGFASTISYPVVYTLAETLGWRGACLVFGLFVCTLVAPVLWLGANRLERSRITRDETARSVQFQNTYFLKRPAFWLLAIGFTFAAIAHGAALHHLLPLLNERGVSAEVAVLAASFIGPMQVAGRLAMMASEKHISHNGVAIAAFIAMALSMVMLLLSSVSPAFITGFVILFGSAYGTVSILRPLLARDILGEEDFGAKSGALALPFLTGSALAPFLGALVWGWGGYDLMLVLLLISIAIGCTLYMLAHRISPTSPED